MELPILLLKFTDLVFVALVHIGQSSVLKLRVLELALEAEYGNRRVPEDLL